MPDLIIGTIITALIVFAIYTYKKMNKKGGCCGNCDMCGNCCKKEKITKK